MAEVSRQPAALLVLVPHDHLHIKHVRVPACGERVPGPPCPRALSGRSGAWAASDALRRPGAVCGWWCRAGVAAAGPGVMGGRCRGGGGDGGQAAGVGATARSPWRRAPSTAASVMSVVRARPAKAGSQADAGACRRPAVPSSSIMGRLRTASYLPSQTL